jgi:hypothetical protein
MSRPKKLQQVNNLKKPGASIKTQEAEGSAIYVTGGLKWVLPAINTKLIEDYSENALLAEPVNNLKNLIFRGEAQVTVKDPEGETDNDLSDQALIIYRTCELYAAHQLALTDEIFGGCSVWSPGWGGIEGVTGVCPVEFRNLPWNSFRDLPQGFMDIYNDIMPGIVIDKGTQKVRAFQKPDDRTTAVEIQNFIIIKDPTSPKPAGKPDCLPVIALITNFNYADKAWNMKMNRVAAPPIFPYVDKITAANKAYVEALAQKWGIKTSFIMTAGMDFKDPKLVESSTAEEREVFLKKRIDGYFNPATFVQKEGSSIGGSDSGAMELIYNYIDKILTMLETQIAAVTLQKWLDDNGFVRYHAEIRHPRPSIKKDEVVRAEVDTLAKYGWITANEARQALPNTDLGELTPEEEAQLQEQVKARQPQNPFGQFGGQQPPEQQPPGAPVGNLGTNPLARPLIVETTQAYLETEVALVAARRKFADAILKGLETI